ncbi:AAA family ATPase [Streptantibioticus parmotrematis]|uniref:AAA family ATPase n=1 Tax=Streptantibioticus parmotrematis TaxID=2873249 RepID=UPI0033C89A1D
MVNAQGRPEGRGGKVPFVGRSDEAGLLDSALERIREGGPAVVDLTGDAGIGKSRLLSEFCARARGRGVTVLCGQATEYERHSPLRPFADALADLTPEVTRSHPVLERLPAVLRGGAEPTAAPAAADRFGLYRATAAALGGLGPDGLVMVLDDLHWADAASLELVDHLVRHRVPAPFLLVLARRDRQTPTALTATLTRGVDSGAVLRIALGPLAERDCVEGLARHLPPPRACALFEASNGNPLYFLALLQAHRDTGPLPQPGFPAAAGAVSGEPDGLPTGLAALLLDELAPLSPACRAAVEAACVLGDRATPELIGELTGAGPEETLDALRELVRRDLLRPGHGGRRLTPRHPLIRALVHESIDPWLREELHRRAAAGLAAAGASAAEQAHHVEQSVTRWDPRAAAVLVTAAEQSAGTAPAAAAHWLQVVLRLLPDTPEHLVTRRELTLRRARALGVGGGLTESRDLLRAVLEMAADDGYDDTRARTVTLLARMERLLGRHRQAEALLRREPARSPGPSPSQAVKITLELCSCVISAARFPEVRADVEQVLAAARTADDRIGEVGALTLRALGEAYEGDMLTARAFATTAAARIEALSDTDLAELCESLWSLGWTEAFLEDYAGAAGHLDQGLEIARRTGQVYLVPQFLTARAYVDLCGCRVTSALRLVDEAEPIVRALGSGDLLAFTLAFQSQILLQARPPGRQSPLAVAEEAVAAAGVGDSWFANLAWCMLAYAALDADDPVRASDLLLRAGGGRGLHRLQPSVRPNSLEALTRAALAVGDGEAAVRWAGLAHREAERLGLPAQRGAGLRGLAMVAAHQSESAEAARLFGAAATQSARSGATLREAQSLLLAAPHAQAAGDRARAAEMWHWGSHLASAGGARLLVDLAERVRPVVFGAPGEPAHELAALTTREREIAVLVAEGLTSAMIAAKLFLSPRTIESHIARIYRKTGVSSRAALASVVTRSGARDPARPPAHRPDSPAPRGAGDLRDASRPADGAARRLVGRESEVGSLIGALAGLRSGRGRAVALVGEPGIGKSSLLWAATARARSEGIPVLAARGRHTTLPTPANGSGRGTSVGVDVRDVGESAVGHTAVVTAVDDVHQIADDRIADVSGLIEATAAGPVLCLLAYRQRQLSPPLAAALSRAVSAGLLEVWNLGPLSEEQSRELLGDLPHLEEVHREAKGNPQYLQVMAADDESVGDAGTAVLGELADLDATAVTVVQVAAVLGGTFHPDLLAAVADLEPDTAMACLDTLTRLDLVRPAHPSPHLSLRHPAIGKVVHSRLEPGRRTALHRRAEAELSKRTAPIAERARHIARAADPHRPDHATTLIAAARGLLHPSPAVAAGYLRVALSLLREGGAHWYEAQVLLARSRLLTGDAAEGQALLGALRSEMADGPPDDPTALADSSRIERHLGRYTEAGALARAGLAALTDSDSATATALHVELADYAYDVQDYPTSRQHAETAAALARGHRDRVSEANALAKAALAHLFTGDHERASAIAARAADLLDAVADATLTTNLEAVHQLGTTEGVLGRFLDAERHLSRGVALSRRTGQTYVHQQILVVLANVRLRFGNLNGALATLDEIDRHAGQVNNPATEAILWMVRAEALLWRGGPGDPQDATATAERAAAVAEGAPTAWAVSVRCFHAEFVLNSGDPARAGRLFLDAAGGSELPKLTAWRRPRWCDALAQAAVATGDSASAERWARLAEAGCEQHPTPGLKGFALRARMRVHADRGHVDRALGRARDALTAFSDSGERIELGRTLLAAATLSLDAGRTDGVRGWLEWGELLADKCGSARLAADLRAQRDRLAARDRAAP